MPSACEVRDEGPGAGEAEPVELQPVGRAERPARPRSFRDALVVAEQQAGVGVEVDGVVADRAGPRPRVRAC